MKVISEAMILHAGPQKVPLSLGVGGALEQLGHERGLGPPTGFLV